MSSLSRLLVHSLPLLVMCLALPGAEGADAEPRRVLLLWQGPDGHPPGTHEYQAGMRVLEACLSDVPGLQVERVCADEPWDEGPAALEQAAGAVLFVSQGARWLQEAPRRYEAFTRLAERGGGLVVLHWGMGTRDAEYIAGFVNLFGGCHGGPDRKFQVVDTQVRVAAPEHETVRGCRAFDIHEEFYYRLKLAPAGPGFQPILQARIDGQDETVAWAWQRPDGGRSFGFSGGHFHANWQRAEYRRLLAQAVLWSVKLPVPEQGLPVEIAPERLTLP